MPNPAWTSTAGDSEKSPPRLRNLDRLVGVSFCLTRFGFFPEDCRRPSPVLTAESLHADANLMAYRILKFMKSFSNTLRCP